MRILLACEFYYPSIGGVQEVMRQLAERFVRAGHEVVVATSHLPERQSLTYRGVAVQEFRVSGNFVRGMTGEVDRYRNFVQLQDYDILMIKAAQQWTFDALIPVLGLIKKPKIFIPCGFSGLFDPLYSQYFDQMPMWFREFDRLIFYASDYRDINLAKKHGLRNISVLSNGADEQEFSAEKDPAFRSRYNIPERAFLVMTVGSLTGLKGHDEVAQAFEKCDFGGTPAFLMLIGNKPRNVALDNGSIVARFFEHVGMMYEAGGLVRIAKWMLRPVLEKLGMGWFLIMLGYKGSVPKPGLEGTIQRINATAGRGACIVDLPRSEVIQAYLNSDLFVFASQIEYSPLVLFEAAAAGLPFLSVPVGNAAEIAQWTGGGVICNGDVDGVGYTRVDPKVLASNIEVLAAQPEVLARLSTEGRRNWKERFSWDKVFRSYEKIVEECLQRTPACLS